MNLNNYLYTEPLNLVVSLLMISGFYITGKLILTRTKFGNQIEKVSEAKYQSVLISTYINVFILFPLILYFNVSVKFIKFLGIFYITLGIINIYNNLKNTENLKKVCIHFKKNKIIFFSLIIILFWCLGPLTNADSLSYHSLVSLNYLNYREIYNLIYFQSFLFGAMDMMNIFSIANGSTQFTSLIQFSCLLSIIGIIKKNSKNKKIFYLLIIITVSSPMLLHFSGSLKPDMILIAGSSLAFCMALKLKKNINYFFFLIIIGLILTINILSKSTFILSAFLIYFFIIFNKETNQKKNKIIFYLVSFFYLIFIAIFYLKKSFFFEEININNFLYPIPSDFIAQKNFIEHIKGPNPNLLDYISFIIPASFSLLTSTFGYTILILFYLFIKKFNLKNKSFLLTLFLLILIFSFSQSRARSYFEVFIWIIIFLSINLDNKFKSKIYTFITALCYPQFIICLLLFVFGTFTISIGSLTADFRENIQQKYAYGYNVFKWLNSNVPENARVISSHRSNSFANFLVIPTDFIQVMKSVEKKDNKLIIKLKDKKPTHIFFIFKNNQFVPKINNINFINCLGKMVKKSEDINADVTRNPFNKIQSKKSKVYLFEFNYKALPECIKKN